MKISVEDVRAVARLARLGLTPEEEAALVAELDTILAHVETLAEVDVSTVEPTAHALALETGLRDDAVENVDQAESLLAGAPDRRERFFRVPKIIE